MPDATPRHLEDAAFEAAITNSCPVWIESPNRAFWIAYDPATDYQLRLVLRPAGILRRPRWTLYATNDQGLISKAVMCHHHIDPSIHIAENLTIRRRLVFPGA
jgi:hypothetical protein